MSTDIKSKKLIILKGFLFLFLGVMTFAMVCWMTRDWRAAVCMGICVWAFCRFYYFAFYVIEKYVDSEYKFSGLYSFCCYFTKEFFTQRHKDTKDL